MIFFASILPSLLLAYVIYRIDRYREPFPKFVAAFGIGLISPIVTLLLVEVTTVGGLLDGPVMGALFAAALPEELGRAILLVVLCRNWKEVDEPFDCVVYGAAIWAGFAATENMLYAFDNPDGTVALLAMRTALCTTGHTAYGAVFGAFVGMGLFVRPTQYKWLGTGLAITVSAHALYNALLFSADAWGLGLSAVVLAYVVDAVMLAFAIFVVLRMLRAQGMSSFEGDRLGTQVRQMQRWVGEGPDIVKTAAPAFGVKGLGLTLICQLLLFGTAYSVFAGEYVLVVLAGGLFFFAVRGLLGRLAAIEGSAPQA